MSPRIAFSTLSLVIVSMTAFSDDLSWNPVQTFSMLALDPDKAAEKGLTVNGLWAGFGMPEAVRSNTHTTTGENEYPVQWSYPTIRDYVDACHAAGVLAPATLMGIAGYPPLRKRFPEIEDGACVGADGQRAYWAPPGGYFMCANNPVYHTALLSIGKEAIDAGADLIVIDEIQGNETCFYWSNQPGFCEHCLAAYREHLGANYSAQELKEKFGIDDLANFNFAKAMDGQRMKTWPDTSPLFKELLRLQERRNFDARAKLISDLRNHMKSVGHVIPVAGNVPHVGIDPWAGGHRFDGLKWSLLLDFLAYENGKEKFNFPPQGKWLANERLAAAAFRYPSATTMIYDPLHKMEMEFIEGKSNRGVFFYYLLAEAAANGCQFINYFQPRFFPQTEPLWEPCFRGQRFIREHRDFFEPGSETGAAVALLYIENEAQRQRAFSYAGLAQALAESNIPYDVLTDGGDGYLPVKLTASMLEKYPLVILPQAVGLEKTQLDALNDYAAAGGTVMTSDPEELGLSAEQAVVEREKGKFVVLPKTNVSCEGLCDLGLSYFQGYEDAVREQIANAVREHSPSVMEVTPIDRTVSVYPWIQSAKNRIVLHVVNSDYDAKTGQMRPKENISIRVKQPPFYSETREARIYSPDNADGDDKSGLAITPVLNDGFITVVVPQLTVWDVIVL